MLCVEKFSLTEYLIFFYSCINNFISFRSSICTLVWQTLGCFLSRKTLNETMYTMWLERQFSSILNLLDLLYFIKMKIRVLINSLFSTPLNYLDNLTLGIMLKFKAIYKCWCTMQWYFGNCIRANRPMKDKTIIIFLHFNLMTVSKYKQYLDN